MSDDFAHVFKHEDGKLVRNTSTPELARWWANVEATATDVRRQERAERFEHLRAEIEKLEEATVSHRPIRRAEEIEEAELRGAQWAFRFSLAHLSTMLSADIFEGLVRNAATTVVEAGRSPRRFPAHLAVEGHVCGMEGFGQQPQDRCPACERQK